MKRNIPTYITLAILLLCPACVLAQAEITVSSRLNDGESYHLAHYYGSRFIKNVASCTATNGKLIFNSATDYEQGCYLIQNAKYQPLYEFVLGQDQRVNVSLSPAGDSVEGGKETCLYSQFRKKQYELSQFSNPDLKDDPAIQEAVIAKGKELERFQDSIIRSDTTSFISSLLKSMQEPRIPESIQNTEECAYLYYKNHYWDNVNLNDSRLLNTPIIDKRLDAFLDKVIFPSADSISLEINKMMSVTTDKDMRQFIVWHLLSKYRNPQNTAYERIFTDVYEQYFQELDSTASSQTARIMAEESYRRLRRLSINAVAPELHLMNANGDYVSSNAACTKYTVLFFYDHDCDICMEEIQDLTAMRDSTVTVFAIDMNGSPDAETSPINAPNIIQLNGIRYKGDNPQETFDVEMTPLLYLLDKDKRIIAKKIMAKQIPDIIKTNEND